MSSTKARVARVLLCSSDVGKLEPLRQRCLAAGTAVDCAIRADQALSLLWQRHYDGAAVDLLLSDRDGISFALDLRQQHPSLSVLVLSTMHAKRVKRGSDWVTRSADYARLIFALKQAGQRSAGRMPRILHVEADDDIASLVQNTIGKQTQLYRARSEHEARVALALREYDLALTRAPGSRDKTFAGAACVQPTLCIDTTSCDPLLSLLTNLHQSAAVRAAAYC